MKVPDLGQMIGPLPLGGWVAVVGGGLGLAYVARRQGGGGGEPEAEAEPEVVTPTFPATPSTAGPINLRPAPVEPNFGTPITDNGQWIGEATRALASRGFAPYRTQQCLAQYLEGVIAGGDCVGIVDAAILAIGPPPSPAPVNRVPIVPAPAPRPTLPPPAPRPAPPPVRWSSQGRKCSTRGRDAVVKELIARYGSRVEIGAVTPYDYGRRQGYPDAVCVSYRYRLG